MADLTLKQIADQKGVGSKTPEATDALLLEQSDGQPAWGILSAVALLGKLLDGSVAAPTDGQILVFRSVGDDWVLEAKPATGTANLQDLTNVTITAVADGNLLIYDQATQQWINLAQSALSIAFTQLTGLLQSGQIDVGQVENAHIAADTIARNQIQTAVRATNAEVDAGTVVNGFVNPATLRRFAGTYLPLDGTAAGGNVTEIDNTHLGRRIKIDQDLTLDNAFGTGFTSPAQPFVVIWNVDTVKHTLTVEAGAGGTGTINGAASIEIAAGGRVYLEAESNAGDEPVAFAVGDFTSIAFGGAKLSGINHEVDTVSGLLTHEQSGGVYVTGGNVTIPNAAGPGGGWWNGTLIAGGAHTVTFDGKTSAAMSAGDVMSIVVQSATVIHAVRTIAADKVAFS